MPRRLIDCLVWHPRFDAQGRQPFRFQTIYEYQQQEPALLALPNTDQRYAYRSLGGHQIVSFQVLPNSNWQIVIPNGMVDLLIRWYHEVAVHAEGPDRLQATIERHFYHPQLRNRIRATIGNCQLCQRMKTGHPQVGQLAPREVPLTPWSEVQVDSIGNWPIKVNGVTLEFNALTMIDTVTNLLEIKRVAKKKSSEETTRVFKDQWLSRYPLPLKVIHDKGPEFTGFEWHEMLADAGISFTYTSSRNPQSNGIIERVHQSIAQTIRTLITLKPPITVAQAEAVVDSALATAMHASRIAANSRLQNFSPGALVFGRDMFLDIPIVSDILTISKARQIKIDRRLIQANMKRRFYDYKVGDQVYCLTARKSKVHPVYTGPHAIESVHTNGTVTIRRGPNIRDRVNIRQIKPAKG